MYGTFSSGNPILDRNDNCGKETIQSVNHFHLLEILILQSYKFDISFQELTESLRIFLPRLLASSTGGTTMSARVPRINKPVSPHHSTTILGCSFYVYSIYDMI